MMKKALQHLKEEIAAACARAGRSSAEVEVIAVSKGHPQEQIAEAISLGLHTFGESRLQEALPKIAAFPQERWHLIGSLQRNKVAKAIGHFALIHSVDSLSLAEKLSDVGQREGIESVLLLQVNVSGEETKQGFSPEALLRLYAEIRSLPALQIQGLMTMAPLSDDEERVRSVFRDLRLLRDQLVNEHRDSLPHLSMGMSGDFPLAIEEGATLIRIGTQLFDPNCYLNLS